MEQRFRVRLLELRHDAEVAPGLLRGLLPRPEAFLEPFAAALQRSQQRRNARTYVHGLLSDLKGKNAEAIAYLHDQERQALQKFVGQAPWDERPLVAELARGSPRCYFPGKSHTGSKRSAWATRWLTARPMSTRAGPSS